MSLCATPLPPACEKELQRLVGLVPDADLSVLVATEPDFKTGGFRAGNGKALRARLLQLVSGPAALSDTLRSVLARRSRICGLVKLLSSDTLVENRHAIAALLGPSVLLIALLLDPRPDIRAKAENWLSLPEPFLPVPPEEALARLREQFGSLSGLLGELPPKTVPFTREAWQDQKEKLENRIRDLHTENRRLKGVDDRLSTAKARIKTGEGERDALQQKLTESQGQLRVKTRELEETAAELTRETAHREDRLAAAVDLALVQEFHGWLAQARAVEAETKRDAPAADLLAQAEAALTIQNAVDRHSGNRTRLADRLESLTEARRKVRDALRNALRQAPELKAVEPALTAEISRLSEQLDPSPPATPLEDALAARIHAAADNDLPALRSLPDLFESLHVLDAPAIARLRNAFDRRLATAQAVGVPAEADTEERQNTVSLLGRALGGQTPAILLVDGHNVLFGLPTRYAPARGTSRSEAEKRQRLTDDLARIAAPSPALRVWIVFDGPTRSDTQAASNVRVTYSGGTGEHRADGVILDNIRFFKSSAPDLPVILASNDNALCGAARRLGARDIPVLELGAFF